MRWRAAASINRRATEKSGVCSAVSQGLNCAGRSCDPGKTLTIAHPMTASSSSRATRTNIGTVRSHFASYKKVRRRP